MHFKGDENEDRHVVIVGGGIVGSAVFFNLALRGFAATLVEADEPGIGATRASFAWINARDKNPLHYHDLNRRSLDMWDRFAQRLNASDALICGGDLRWCLTETAADDMAARVRTLTKWGYPIRTMNASEAVALEPGLLLGDARATSHSDADGHVDATRVVDACIAGAMVRGRNLRTNTRVTGFRMSEDRHRASRVVGVNTSRGEVKCSHVVIAAGPEKQVLAEMAGVHVPVSHSFGATIVTEPISPILNTACVVHTPREVDPQLNVRQFADGAVMIHGGSHGGAFDGSIGRIDEEIAYVMDAAGSMIPALRGVGIRGVRRGRRPLPQDGLPILGFAQAVPNMYLAAMHSGVTLAVLVGEFAALEIAEGVRTDLFAPYRVERF